MLTAFLTKVCLQPASVNSVSSKLVIVFDLDLAAFHRVEPHIVIILHNNTYVIQYM